MALITTLTLVTLYLVFCAACWDYHRTGKGVELSERYQALTPTKRFLAAFTTLPLEQIASSVMSLSWSEYISAATLTALSFVVGSIRPELAVSQYISLGMLLATFAAFCAPRRSWSRRALFHATMGASMLLCGARALVMSPQIQPNATFVQCAVLASLAMVCCAVLSQLDVRTFERVCDEGR